MNSTLVLRIRRDNPNHHLWDNNGTWFIHYTVHRSDFTKFRIRESLCTRSLAVARRLRNRILCSLEGGSVLMNQGPYAAA